MSSYLTQGRHRRRRSPELCSQVTVVSIRPSCKPYCYEDGSVFVALRDHMVQDQVANSVLLRKTHTRNLEELIEGCAGVHMTVER
jgi:hypothetical protein